MSFKSPYRSRYNFLQRLVPPFNTLNPINLFPISKNRTHLFVNFSELHMITCFGFPQLNNPVRWDHTEFPFVILMNTAHSAQCGFRFLYFGKCQNKTVKYVPQNQSFVLVINFAMKCIEPAMYIVRETKDNFFLKKV